jgi:hypothetical protein
VLDDGDAFKIGHTTGPPALRVAGLQTGNPRVIRAVATIAGASPEVEAHLHRELAEWIRRGEWFEREPIENKVERAGGWAAFLRQHLPAAEWQIEVYV